MSNSRYIHFILYTNCSIDSRRNVKKRLYEIKNKNVITTDVVGIYNVSCYSEGNTNHV